MSNNQPPSNESPSLTIKNLNSRHANKDARSAFNCDALFISILPSGNFVLCDRSQNFYLEISEPPTREEFALYHKLLNTSRMSAQSSFLGEPSTQTLASDLRRQSRETVQKTPRSKENSPLNLGIEL